MRDYEKTLNFQSEPDISIRELVAYFDKLYEFSEERLLYTAKLKNLI